jgi:hypothetical protein
MHWFIGYSLIPLALNQAAKTYLEKNFQTFEVKVSFLSLNIEAVTHGSLLRMLTSTRLLSMP